MIRCSRVRRSIVTMLVVTALGACASDGDDPTLEAGGDAPTTSVSPSTTAGPAEAGTDHIDTPFESTRVSTPAQGRGLLTDVRVGAHDGFVRIVFEFEESLP